MAGNKALIAASIAKQDEFYTQLSDIENELAHYTSHFKDKVVLCNCDDPYESNFFKYFAMNFNKFGLKKLIATCYSGSPIIYSQLNIFEDEPSRDTIVRDKKPYRIEITEVNDANNDGRIDLADVEHLIKNDSNTLSLLKGDGDFRSPECVELLKQADIVATNPPFSLFREYLAHLIGYEKKFVILGNQNIITYKEVFPLLKDNKLWLGYHAGDMAFTVPQDYEPRETRYWEDENGQKWRSFGNICWFTNLDIPKRHEPLTLFKKYDPAIYPSYVNYNAINVDKVANIPCDYDGVMGVPITFMEKYDPDQFEIVGADYELAKPVVLSNGKRGTGRFYIKNDDGTHHRLYFRIAIRERRHQ